MNQRVLGGAVYAAALFTAAAFAANPPDVGRLRLSDVQVLGSHNSYHQRPDEASLKLAIAVNPAAREWDYSRAPLDVQLDQGVRSFELDLHLGADGWEVFHAPVVDFRTSCRRFVDCLKIVRRWSDAHPGHVPVSFLLELKEEGFTLSSRYRRPESADLDLLDENVVEAFGRDRLVAPDDLRGDSATLPEAIRTRGWPTLEACKGKVLFILHETGRNRELYAKDRPALEGRAMFVNSTPPRPDAAAMVLDDPRDRRIPTLVQEGFLVRTRVDTRSGRPTEERRSRAFESGAQILSTDYPKGEADAESGYVVELPDGAAALAGPFAPPRLRGRPIFEPIP
jgi:hypothetical protein